MKLPRRTLLHLAAGAAALPVVMRVASALDYPTRPVSLVAGFAPGGGVDITARLIGQWLSERLGQQFVIENRPGASSNIATEAVVRSQLGNETVRLRREHLQLRSARRAEFALVAEKQRQLVHFEHVGEIDLGQPFVLAQPKQHDPLRARGTAGFGTVIDIVAQQSRALDKLCN